MSSQKNLRCCADGGATRRHSKFRHEEDERHCKACHGYNHIMQALPGISRKHPTENDTI